MAQNKPARRGGQHWQALLRFVRKERPDPLTAVFMVLAVVGLQRTFRRRR